MSNAGSVAPSYDSSLQIIPAPPAEPIEVVILDPEDDEMEVDAAMEGADGDSSDETDPSEDPAWAPAGDDMAAVADLPMAEADLPLVPFQAAPLPALPIRAVRDFPVGCAGPSRPIPTQSETIDSPYDRRAPVDREPLPTPPIPVPSGMRLVPVCRGHNGWISDDSDDESTASVEHIAVPIPPAGQEEHVAPMTGHATTTPATLPTMPEPVP